MEMEAKSGVRPRVSQSQSAIGSETERGEAGHDRIRRRKDFKEASDSDKLLIYEHENGKGRKEGRWKNEARATQSTSYSLSLSFDAERNCGCPPETLLSFSLFLFTANFSL